MSSMDVASASARAANSYDFVRFFAASCVLFSHHFDIAGFPEPRVPFYGGEDFGYLGVEIFFCLSGFLITQSLQRRREWVRFAAARVCRIVPNLLFALVVTSAVTLAWYRNGAHLAEHVGYVVRNALMFFWGVTQTVPGVFEDTVRRDMNDPLWTLPYELWLYVLLALIFFAAGRRSGAVIFAVAVAISLAWTFQDRVEFGIGTFESPEFLRLGTYFLSGATMAVMWPYIKSHAVMIGAVGLVAALVLRNTLPLDSLLFSLTLAAAVIGLGSSHAMAWFSKGGDASYGMYVFAWPVQQFSLLLIGSFWLSMLAAFGATVALGYATWHAFEKRATAYPDKIAARFRQDAASRPTL
jgi:peptidoglycan/LPS O-acetylase OafA/YrhL